MRGQNQMDVLDKPRAVLLLADTARVFSQVNGPHKRCTALSHKCMLPRYVQTAQRFLRAKRMGLNHHWPQLWPFA